MLLSLTLAPSSRHNTSFGGAYAGLWVCSLRGNHACLGGNRSHVQHGVHARRSFASFLRRTHATQATLGAGSALHWRRYLPDPRAISPKPHSMGPTADLGLVRRHLPVRHSAERPRKTTHRARGGPWYRNIVFPHQQLRRLGRWNGWLSQDVGGTGCLLCRSDPLFPEGNRV